MATTINAGPGGLSVSPDVSGQIQFQSGGTTIATIGPTGLQQNVGAPAFSAYPSSAQSISSVTNTKGAYNTKNFDTAGCYNNTSSTVTLNGLSVPSYSFCPNVAGYYQVSATSAIYGQSGTGGYMSMYIQKNGVTYGGNLIPLIATIETIPCTSCLLYLNGTGDYVSINFYQSSGSTLNMDSVTFANFSAVLVRSA